VRIAILGLKGIPATYGGVEHYTEEVAARLVSRGHEVLVYCRAHYTPREAACAAYRGIQLVRLPSLRLRTTDTLSHTLLATLDIIRRRADVVIFHSLGNAAFAALPRAFAMPTALVLHEQEWRKSEWGEVAHLFFHLSERASFLTATRVCTIAQWLQDDLRRRHGQDTTNVSTGVELLPPRPPERLNGLGLAPRNYLLFVGRLVPQKRPDLLIRAYRELGTHMPLVVVGDAPHNQAYHDTLRALATPGVRFLGYRYGAELAELYSHAYLYILPSESEGIALTLLEALSYGNAVVVSDIPQNRELTDPIGFTFSSGDSQSLREVLQTLLDRSDLVEARRAQGRAHVADRYSWDAVADRYERLCADLVAPGKRKWNDGRPLSHAR
jgi:glycosyltransferase involved in cell wall biosynthesis